MKNADKIFFLFIVALSSGAAQAQFFQCKDATGRTISSDRPIPECADRAVRELGRNGMLKREVPAPLSADEKQQKKLEEDKRKAEMLALEEQRKSDRLILERYGNEKGIEAARKRALDLAQDIIKRENGSIAAAEKQLAQSQAALAPYKAKPESAPLDVRNKIKEAEQTIREGEKIIHDRRAEMVQTNAKYDETLKRFREIAGNGRTLAEGNGKAP